MRLSKDETVLDGQKTFTIIFDNLDFDESQGKLRIYISGQEKEKVLPIPHELKVLRYSTYNKNNQQVEGFIFVYPSQNSVFYAETQHLSKLQS